MNTHRPTSMPKNGFVFPDGSEPAWYIADMRKKGVHIKRQIVEPDQPKKASNAKKALYIGLFILSIPLIVIFSPLIILHALTCRGGSFFFFYKK